MNDKIKRCRDNLTNLLKTMPPTNFMAETVVTAIEALDDYEKVKMIAENNTYMREADAKLLKELQAELSRAIVNIELLRVDNKRLSAERDNLKQVISELPSIKEIADIIDGLEIVSPYGVRQLAQAIHSRIRGKND